LLLRQEFFVRRMLLRFGVASADLDDVTQEVLLGAWQAIREGRFRPRGGSPLDGSLRAWLCGIAFRQSSHYRNVAHRRREVPVPDFRTAMGAEGSYRLDDQLVARAVLRKLRVLSPELQEVLALAAGGATGDEIAEVIRTPLMTAASRIRRGRAVFARVLKRWWKP
jgi:RNA polymerase sigma-70 factor (ECF subfamily)